MNISMRTMTTRCLPAHPRDGLVDYQQAVHVLRAAASDAGQSEARRQWIRAATQC